MAMTSSHVRENVAEEEKEEAKLNLVEVVEGKE